MEKMKEKYNENLKRYYAGVNYIEEHTDECDKYLPAVLNFLCNVNSILEKIRQIEEVTEQEILEGFAV